MKRIEKSVDIGGKKLTLSTGYFAQQATGAVMAQMGETVVMATVVSAPLRVDPGYFPLKVDYIEPFFAAGKIKGSRWVKRDGRPTDDNILTARLVDRSIRPLFAKEYKKDVQVIIKALSLDLENDPSMLGAVAVAAAIEASEIPWMGPVATVKVGLVDGKHITYPTVEEIAKGDMELTVSMTDGAIVMIENGSKEVGEDQITAGIEHAMKEGKVVLKLIKDFATAVGIKKEALPEKQDTSSIKKALIKAAGKDLPKLVSDMATKEAVYADMDALRDKIVATLGEEDQKSGKDVFEELFNEEVRKMILSGKRPDGRGPKDLRNLSAEIGILPRTHGSGLFQRGQTQAMTVATLGARSLAQSIETPIEEEKRRYFHHYSMPPYSVGETGRVGFPSRREIGHGMLAEKALKPVLPDEIEFPYTMQVVTDILSSNGSTSMASTCGSSLALMDAGVPIKAPVGGIAMGLIIESEKKFTVLTDIVGIEDGGGDMDFKVAGTTKGITALQLDVKSLNLTVDILKEALVQAKEAREQILKVMTDAISTPKGEVSEYAPKIKIVKIPEDKIGELIGPGGKNIKALSARTGAEIDVDDEGNVSIATTDAKALKEAVDFVEALAKEVEIGEIYKGEVVRIEGYGAFVEILPGRQGLVHVSNMAKDFVEDPNTVVKMGQEVEVKVRRIDEKGINLTMNLEDDGGGESQERPPRRDNSFNRGGGSRGGFRRDSQGGGSRDKQEGGQSGPHFPVSRLTTGGNSKKNFNR